MVYYHGNVAMAHRNLQSVKVGVCTMESEVEKLRSSAIRDGMIVRVEQHTDRSGSIFKLYGTPKSLIQKVQA